MKIKAVTQKTAKTPQSLSMVPSTMKLTVYYRTVKIWARPSVTHKFSSLGSEEIMIETIALVTTIDSAHSSISVWSHI